MQRHKGQTFLPQSVASLKGYPSSQVLCSTGWGLWCDWIIDQVFPLPSFASSMPPQKTLLRKISSCKSLHQRLKFVFTLLTN